MSNAELQEKKTKLKGYVKAKLQASNMEPSTFEAEFLHIALHRNESGEELQILAYMGDLENEFTAIFLAIPRTTQNAHVHNIESGMGIGGIRAAFINYSGAGYTGPGGQLTDFRWSADKKSVSFGFSFSATTELRTYHVGQGELTVSYNAPDSENKSTVIGSASAQLKPPVFEGHESFEADQVSFQASGNGSHQLVATQSIDGSRSQGIFLVITGDSAKPKISALFLINNGVHLTRDQTFNIVKWDQSTRTFNAKFELDFTSSAGKQHEVRSGVIDLKY